MSIGVQPKVTAVSVQDNTNPVIFSHAVTSLATNLSLASDVSIGATSVVLNAGHGFVSPATTPGQMLIIPGYYMGEVLSVSTNTIGLDTPLGYAFAANTAVTRANKYLNKDGSSVPIMFGVSAVVGRIFDITGFTMTLLSASPMDDSLFGSLTKLTNGLTCRIKRSASWYNNVFVARSNQNLALFGTLEYTTKAPSGKYGVRFHFSFRDYGTTCRLVGSLGQQLEIIVRDNLSTLEDMEIMIHGHVVDDTSEKENAIIHVTDAWTPLTAAGENVAIWTYSDTPMWVTSSLSGSPLSTTGFPIRRVGWEKPLSLNADDQADIFYAKCISPGDTADIIVDYI